MDHPEEPIRAARQRRERVLEECRERIAQVSTEQARARTQLEKSSPAERPGAERMVADLERLKQRALHDTRSRIERATEAVRAAESGELHEDGARAAVRLDEALHRLELAGGDLRASLETMREAADEVNRVLAKARVLAERARQAARDATAARERAARGAEDAGVPAEAREAAGRERDHHELVRAREEAHAADAQGLFDTLAGRKERALAVLNRHAEAREAARKRGPAS